MIKLLILFFCIFHSRIAQNHIGSQNSVQSTTQTLSSSQKSTSTTVHRTNEFLRPNDVQSLSSMRSTSATSSSSSSNNNDFNQLYQQKTNKQLLEINEILSKSKSQFAQIVKQQEQQMKIFPEDPPPPPPVDMVPIIKKPKVTLSRLTSEDEELMQKSLSEFAMKSPDLARKLGVIKDEADTFSKMKADGE